MENLVVFTARAPEQRTPLASRFYPSLGLRTSRPIPSDGDRCSGGESRLSSIADQLGEDVAVREREFGIG
jgi:hypothetical protein